MRGWGRTHRGLVIDVVQGPEEVQALGGGQLPLVRAVRAQRVQDLSQQVHLPGADRLRSGLHRVVALIEVRGRFLAILGRQPKGHEMRAGGCVAQRAARTQRSPLRLKCCFSGTTRRPETGNWLRAPTVSVTSLLLTNGSCACLLHAQTLSLWEAEAGISGSLSRGTWDVSLRNRRWNTRYRPGHFQYFYRVFLAFVCSLSSANNAHSLHIQR